MTLERWQTISRHDQLLHIGADLLRAAEWQKENREKFIFFLKKAIELTELTEQDPKWEGQLLSPAILKKEMEKFLIGEKTENIETLYQSL